MVRFIYRAQCLQFEKALSCFESQRSTVEKMIKSDKLMTLSIFYWEEELFLYYECFDEVLEPHDIFIGAEDCLIPSLREKEFKYWLPMADIFHYSIPKDKEHWKRKSPVQRRPACMARLKPEMIASYIFYHYQLQEEKPGIYDKYGIIGLHENLLFHYLEEPVVIEPVLHKGKLDTRNSPENWQDVMDPHFIKWQGVDKGQEIWRAVVPILEL